MFFSRFLRQGRPQIFLRRSLQQRHASLSTAGASSSRTPHLLHSRITTLPPSKPTNDLTPLEKLNTLLRNAALRDDLGAVVNICRQISEDGHKPDADTYEHVMSILGQDGLLDESWAVLADMDEMGIEATSATFAHLLEAAQNVPEAIHPILTQMQDRGIPLDVTAYEHIVAHHANFQNLAMCLRTLDSIHQDELRPTLRTVETIIDTACRGGMPVIALDVARNFESNTYRRLQAYVWLQILESSAELFSAEGVQIAWTHAIIRGGIAPTEGLLLQILNTAARHGLSELATDVLRVLRLNGYAPLEHHVAAVLEAHVVDNKIKHAFALVGKLRTSLNLVGAQMTAETTHALRAWVAQQTGNVDKAWGIMEDLYRNGGGGGVKGKGKGTSAVDIAALNAVVGGAIDLDDMQRAIGIYKEASSAFGVQPDVETLNILLSGCIATSRRELGDSLVNEMRTLFGIEPDAVTYERMIQLCLMQATYEDAFYFLEEMKAAGFRPTLGTYDLIVRRTFEAFDPRWKIALSEMKEKGYSPSYSLKALIDNSLSGNTEKGR